MTSSGSAVERTWVPAALASVGVGLFLFGSLVPSWTVDGEPRHPQLFLGTSSVALWQMLPYAVIVGVTLWGAAASIRHRNRHWPAGLLLGLGGALVLDAGKDVFLWLVPSVAPTVGGYARVLGPILVVGAAILARRTSTDGGGRWSIAPAAGAALGTALVALAHFVPVASRHYLEGSPRAHTIIDLERLGRMLGSGRILHGAFAVLPVVIVLVLAVRLVLARRPLPLAASILTAVASLQLAFGLQTLGVDGPAIYFGVEVGTYVRIAGALLLLSTSAWLAGISPGASGSRRPLRAPDAAAPAP